MQTESLSDAAARLRSALETRQLNVLPIAELTSAAPAAPNLGSDIPGQGQGREDSSFNSTMEELSDIVSGYADRVAAVDYRDSRSAAATSRCPSDWSSHGRRR